MPRPTQMKRVAVFLCLAFLFAGCEIGDVPPTIPVQQATPTPESAAGSGATPTVTSQPESTPSPWMGALLEPGPTFAAPDQIFFQNGPDVWLLDGEQEARQVTSERRISQMASAPDGSRAAVIARTELGSRAAEELVLIDPEGSASEPLYGPSVITGPGANPQVVSLAWSPNGSKLALVFDDGSAATLSVDGSGDVADISPTGEGREITQFVWAPDGTGAVLLIRDEAGIGHVALAPADGSEQTVLDGGQSYGIVTWLAGQARLIAAEDRRVPANPHAGSIFSIAPDGSGRELLVSAGRFAPVVDILKVAASPDGAWLAFGVYTPGTEGEAEFQSLWVLNFETGELIQIPVQNNLRVTDLWWTTQGLVWRGVDEQAPTGDDITAYTGSEPFLLSLYDFEDRQSRVVFQGGVQE